MPALGSRPVAVQREGGAFLHRLGIGIRRQRLFEGDAADQDRQQRLHLHRQPV